MSPETVARVVEDRPANRLAGQEYLTPQLMGDWPLRYVWLAHRLFWA
jgi:hypothetical protein